MPRTYKTKGYDPLVLYSEAELVQMYVKEGKPLEEAKTLARQVYLEIHRLNMEEYRMWDKVRNNEQRMPFIDNSDADNIDGYLKRNKRGHGPDE